MKKQVYKIDSKGFIAERYVVELNKQGNPIDELAENIITIDPPEGLYRAKWTGTEWVEDMSQEEINELNSQSRDKTQLEILQETVDMLVLDNLGVL